MKKIFLLFLLSTISISAFSAVIVVENINDAGTGSLRQAIVNASNGDSIVFNPNLIAGGNNSIVLTSGEITFNKNLTFIGLITSTDTLFVSGNNSSRVFNITGGTTKMEKMAIVDGYSHASGGGINAYALILTNSIVKGNTVISTSSTTSSMSGGGVFAYNLTLINTTISENTAYSTNSTVNGGGVYSTYLTINHSKILNNEAICTTASSSAVGGGIKTNHLVLNNSVVSGNKTSGFLPTGGGIYVTNSLSITNSTISENTITSIGSGAAQGGGLYAYAASGGTIFNIDNSIFTGNKAISATASANGGGIYARSNSVLTSSYSTLNITNSSLIGDTAITSSSSSNAAGGSIYAANISVTIDKTTVTGNTATSSSSSATGGAFYISTNNSGSTSYSALKILNSKVSGNSTNSTASYAYGGAIYAISNSINYTSASSQLYLLIENSSIQGNLASASTASAYGGGIYAVATANQSAYATRVITTINNSSISDNIANSPTSTCLGGGIYASSSSDDASSTITVNYSTISGNTASSTNSSALGGGIYARSAPSFGYLKLISNYSTIYGNTASSNSSNVNALAEGGGIYIGGTAESLLTLKSTTISGNTASSNSTEEGGGIKISLSNSSNSTNVFTIGSSIVAGNAGDNDISGTISVNNGYNIFGESPTAAVGTDQTNVTSASLNLGPLQNNGGSTFTVAPGVSSVAVDMGSPSDATNAQNGSIVGLRDVGAAEFGISACPAIVDTITISICFGESYSFGGNNLSNTGKYRDTVASSNGCDSVIVLELLVDYLLTGVDVQSACETFTWTNGITYTTNNTLAKDTLTSATGCDSIVTLYLIINNSESVIDTQIACGSFTWIDGNTYTANNNTATQTLSNANGCDSIVTLNLTITNSVTGTDVQTACGSYTWIDGNTYTANNNTATFTIPNGPGCDSIVTLDLTITNSVTGTDVQTACESFTWIDGITYTANNNTATFTIPNGPGCDSIVTLNLTINTVNVSTSVNANVISANANGASYQWIDCNNGNAVISGANNQTFTPQANGDYAVIVMSNNCSDTSDCVNIYDLSIPENSFGKTVRLYPNPTSDNFTIEMGGIGEVNIAITDITGKTVYFLNGVNTSQMEVGTESFSKGVYFVKIQNEEEQVVVKLVRQ